MEPFDIKEGQVYASRRWRGNRSVVEVKRHRGQDAVVHYIDVRTSRTGNAPLLQFATSAEKNVLIEIRS
jgi:hypothetical protein